MAKELYHRAYDEAVENGSQQPENDATNAISVPYANIITELESVFLSGPNITSFVCVWITSSAK